MNHERCALCGEDFEPEASKYDDICDGCAEVEEDYFHEAMYNDDGGDGEISRYAAW